MPINRAAGVKSEDGFTLIDLLVYTRDELKINRHRRFAAKDPDLLAVHAQWEQALRKAVQELPPVRFGEPGLEP